MNSTHRGKSFRRRNEAKIIKTERWDNSWSEEKAALKAKKTPAVVEEVVQIVTLKEAYHKLRNLGK